MLIKKIYSQKVNKIICINNDATPEYWDNQWSKTISKSEIASTPFSWVYRITKRYLQPGTKILEGGCGIGQYVYSLNFNNYDVYGVDYADSTVRIINEVFPELNVSYGDVNNLLFDDNFFDGYWSIGVIEHDWQGYENTAKEMHRVLRPGGYLFLSFPAISYLRRLKIHLSNYEQYDFRSKPVGFYQYILDRDEVIGNFEKLGFSLVHSSWLGGFKGLKDEVSFLSLFLNFINKIKFRYVRLLIYVFDIMVRSFSGNSAILILRKNK